MLVRAPASSANLGPGFDCLGLALALPFWLAVDEPDGLEVDLGGGRVAVLADAGDSHPVSMAFREAGGPPGAALRVRSPIPPGRGLGYSGAARVAGAFAAGCLAGLGDGEARRLAFEVAARLEGHPDNAAASAFGSFTVAVVDGDDATALRLDVPAELRVMVWWPDAETATNASRASLPSQVGLADAAFSAGRSALWVAAMASGDLAPLRAACGDRLHQATRLAARPDSAAALARLLDEPAVLAAWLSGSGPTVAALVGEGTPVLPGLPPGHVRLLDVERAGVARVPVTTNT